MLSERLSNRCMGIDLTKLRRKPKADENEDVVKRVLDDVFREEEEKPKKVGENVAGDRGEPKEQGEEIGGKAEDLKLHGETGDSVDAFRIPEAEPVSGTEQQTGFWHTYIGDWLERLGAGAADFGGSMYGLVDLADKYVFKYVVPGRSFFEDYARRQFEKEHPGQEYKSWLARQEEGAYNYANTLRGRSDRYAGKDFVNLFDEGRYGDMVGDVFLSASESLPQSAVAMAGGPAGLALTGATAGKQKYYELDRMPEAKDMGETKKVFNAVATGTFEALSEKLGDVQIGKYLKRLYQSGGKEVVEKAVKEETSNLMSKGFKKAGILFAPVAEGIEEVSSQVAENVTDYATGVTDRWDPFEGGLHAFVYGMGGGAQFSGVGGAIIAKNRIERFNARRDYRKAKGKLESVFADDKDVGMFVNGLTYMSPAEQEAVVANMARGGNVTEEQLKTVADFAGKANVYRSYLTREAKEREREAVREQWIDKRMQQFDEIVCGICNENGKIQGVTLNGEQEAAPVYIVRGELAVTRNEEGGFVVDVVKSSPELYYRDDEGQMQVVSPANVQAVSYDDVEVLRADYERALREGVQAESERGGIRGETEESRDREGMKGVESRVMPKDSESREIEEEGGLSVLGEEAESKPGVENGSAVVYVNEEGKQVRGVVADAFSSPEYVFLADGTPVPRGKVLSISPEEESKGLEGEAVTVPNREGVKGEVESVFNGEEQEPAEKGFEVEEGVFAKEDEEGNYRLDVEFSKSELKKGDKLVDRLNVDYEDEGIMFELVKLPRRDAENPLEKSRWGIVGRRKTEEVKTVGREPINNVVRSKIAEAKFDDPEAIVLVNRGDGRFYVLYQDALKVSRAGEYETKFNGEKEIYAELPAKQEEVVKLEKKGFKVRVVDVLDEAEAEGESREDGKSRTKEEAQGNDGGENPFVVSAGKGKMGRTDRRRFAEKDKALGDYVSVRDEVLRGIATGRFRFMWNDQDIRRGISKELGFVEVEEERRRRFWMFDNRGYSIDGLAHQLSEASDSPGYRMNPEEIRNEIIDVMNVYDTPTAMIEAAEGMRVSGEERRQQFFDNMTDEEREWYSQVLELQEELRQEQKEDIPLELEEQFLAQGVTEKELSELHTLDDFIKFGEFSTLDYGRSESEPGGDSAEVGGAERKGGERGEPSGVEAAVGNGEITGGGEKVTVSAKMSGYDALNEVTEGKEEISREDIAGVEADEQQKDMALDYLNGDDNIANRLAYLSIKNKIENDRNRSIYSERGGKGGESRVSSDAEVVQSGLSEPGEGGRDVVSGDAADSGAGGGNVPGNGSQQIIGGRDDNGTRDRGGIDEFSGGNGVPGVGSVSGSTSRGNGEGVDSVHAGGSRRSAGDGKERVASSHSKRSDSRGDAEADTGREYPEGDRKAALEAELDAALSDFNDVLSKFKSAGRKDLSLSLAGLTNEQVELIGEVVAAGAKVGYVLLKKGIYSFQEWAKALSEYIGGKLRECGLTDEDVEELIDSMWDTKVRDGNGERKKISELAQEYGVKPTDVGEDAPFPLTFQDQCRINLEKQRAAESVPVVVNDVANIRATLPMLLAEQQEDVVKAESRFFEQNKKGILFTNGTGTGKTYTGLGVVKRLAKQGREDVLIVVPSSEKVNDWSNDGRNLLLNITPLKDTKDGGEGICVTTYANFRENEALKRRAFDLVVYDECHRIMESAGGEYSATTITHFKMTNKSVSYAVERMRDCDKDYQHWKEIEAGIRAVQEQKNETKEVKDRKIKLLEKEREEAEKLWKAKEPAWEEQAKEDVERTKVLFLSATPFKSVFNLRYADGYLFDFPESDYAGYNVPTGENLFYIENFGARFQMRYGRLETKGKELNPEAVSMQEIEFQQKLTREGAMSGRAIESNMDYSREFVKPSSDDFNTELFNEALNAIWDYEHKTYEALQDATRKIFYNYQYSTRLMEALKTSMFIPRIENHIRLGRKVVLFHRRKQADVAPPFASIIRMTKAEAVVVIQDKAASSESKAEAKLALEQCEDFRRKFARLLSYESTLNYDSAIDQVVNYFGKERVRLFNGDVSAREKSIAVKEFNDDDSGVDIIMIQEESGKEGISLHDRTGRYQRVLMSLSAPISSITALQIEGRIYRIGQASNAIFEYPTLGLDSELVLFSQNINRKLSTTENLALGDSARDLIKSFAEGIENWSEEEPGEGQGTGGKEADQRQKSIKSDYEKAVLTYFTNQKKRGSRNEREGIDYFATPEPLGYKLVEWTGIRTGEWLLEPSAGHGAIAMWVPANCGVTAIEPSFTLFARLGGKVTNGNAKVLNTTFEQHDLVNKYDVIAMNPPFGAGGAMAMSHIEKAFKHLRKGGRLVAIVPNGGSMNKKLEKFLYGEDGKGNLLNPDALLVGEVVLPGCTFEQAGTTVYCRVVVIDKVGEGVVTKGESKRLEFNYCKDIKELFDELQYVTMPARPEVKEEVKEGEGGIHSNGEELASEVIKTQHTKTGGDLFVVKLNRKVERDEYKGISGIVKQHEGYWSRFVEGFIFNSNEAAESFREQVNSEQEEVRYRKERGLIPSVFFSNAEYAIKSIQQEKAAPVQWLGMLQKNGGLKAGEDEWLGLSDWLKGADQKSVSKQEILDFIAANEVEVKETELQEKPTVESSDGDIDYIRLKFTTDGLKDKREIVMMVPGIEKWEKRDSIHFGRISDGKAVVWVRFGETRDREGKRVLVIDEIQSKRHQIGRKHGYLKDFEHHFADRPEAPYIRRYIETERLYRNEDISALEAAQRDDQLRKDIKDAGLDEERTMSLAQVCRKEYEKYYYPPVAPFAKNWQELGLKRMLRYAAEQDFDRLAWTKGEQQAVRYDLGSVIGEIEWYKNNDVYIVYGRVPFGETLLLGQGINGKELSRILGQNLADRILQSDMDHDILDGEDLRVGFSGVSLFYDKVLVDFMNKYGKKWGVKVEEVVLPDVEEAGRKMWGVKITPKMKDSVIKGQPLFRESSGRVNRIGKVLEEIGRLEKGLGVKVNVVRSREELPDALKKGMKGDARYPGVFSVKTGEVYTILDEITDEADAQRTVLHEVVGHKGLRGLLGDRFGDFCEEVLRSMKEEERAAWIRECGGDRQLAAEEYLASFAEEERELSIWAKVKGALRDVLRKMGVQLRLSDNDLKYLLWKGAKRLKGNEATLDIVDRAAKDYAMYREVEDERFETSMNVDISQEERIKFHNEIVSRKFRFVEAYQDRMLAVKRLQELLEAKIGKKLPFYMNCYYFENTLASRNTYEIEHFRKNELKQMTDAIAFLEGAGLTSREIENYVICKHGIERNAYIRRKKVEQWYRPQFEELERQRGKTMSEARYQRELLLLNEEKGYKEARLASMDFSGLKEVEKELKGGNVDAFIQRIESSFPNGVKELWAGIKGCTDLSLRKWFESGMTNRKQYDRVRGMFENYVPLRGFDETIASDVFEYFNEEGNGFNSPLRSAKGRRSRADSPFAYIVSLVESSIVGGNKNLMKLHLFRAAQKYPSDLMTVSRAWFREVGKDAEGNPLYETLLPIYDSDPAQYRQNVEAFDREMAKLAAEEKVFKGRDRLKVGYRLLNEEPQEHVVRCCLNGEPFHVLIHGNPRAAQAVEGLNDEERIDHKVLNAIRWMNRQMAANFTTRNPAFVLSNLTRDIIFSITTLSVKEGRKYRNRFVRNIYPASGAIRRYLQGKPDKGSRTDVLFEEFLKNGGETGYTALYNIERFKKMIDQAVVETKRNRVVKAGMKVIDFFAAGNRWAEDLSRFSVYVTSREMGRSVLESVHDAKEVTVNFNKKGSGALGAQVFKSLYLFFNAAVQSMSNFYQLYRKNPQGTCVMMSGYAVAGMIVPLLLHALGGEEAEEEYLTLPDYVRKNNLCFYLGKKRGFVTLPLPIELRAFFGIGDAAYRYFRGDIDGLTASGETILGMLDVLPLSPSGNSAPFVPDAIKPIAQSYYLNEDFIGIPVAKVTPYNQYLPEYRRVYRGTSDFFVRSAEVMNYFSGGDYATRGYVDQAGKVVSDLLNMEVNVTNPAAMEHLYTEYLGGMYKTIMQALKTGAGLYDWAKTGDNSKVEVRSVPLLNRFYNRNNAFSRQSKINEAYFRCLDELKEYQSRLHQYEEAAYRGKMNIDAVIGRYSKLVEDGSQERAEVIKYYSGEIGKIREGLGSAGLSNEEREELEEEVLLLKRQMLETLEELGKE